MRATAVALLVIVAAAIVVPASGAEPANLRVGVYDNRAVTVAYAHSEFNPVDEKMKKHKQAEAQGDTGRMKELEAWGERHQHELHLKGFCHAPVDDLLAYVEDRLPEVARRTGVDVIARACDYVAEDVDVVDVTMELVALFDPGEEALRTIEQMEGVEAVPLADIERHGH